MLEILKNKIWDILKKKDVSLVMIYDSSGEIYWHRGREITGKDVFNGVGFCKSLIKDSIVRKESIQHENVLLSYSGDDLSKTAISLSVKSLLIIPLGGDLFLYLDSGSRDRFDKSELDAFTLLGELLRELIGHLRSQEIDGEGLTGDSEAMQSLRELILKFSFEDEPVLLLGETGVGKSFSAKLIHNYSGRKGRFVNAGAPDIQENLFESTLFGHKKGSFTDAYSDRMGLVQAAENGTLFIDEIAEIPIASQAKLLNFIETKKYRVLGENFERKANIRIITATNVDLVEAIRSKKFREDLFYRLNILELKIPPLRERKEDIRNLVMANRMFLKGKVLKDDFWSELLEYDWPGNIRELFTILKQAGILLDSPIDGKGVSELIKKSAANNPAVISNSSQMDENKKIDEMWNLIEEENCYWDVIWRPFLDRKIDASVVKEVIKKAYKKGHGNFKDTVRILNIEMTDYPRFISYLHKYNIHPDN